MQMTGFGFSTTEWDNIAPTKHAGETGVATWRTQMFGAIRVRRVDYSAGYLADHWCDKGHVIFCIEGELETELADGSVHKLTPGMSYQVADDAMAHRSRSSKGAQLFIVD